MKRHYAKSYGEKNTPCRALKAMRQGGVPTDLRPSTGQLKHARRQLQFCPPECVSRDLWGPEIVVGYLAWNHFEATGPLQECSR